ncbi:MAG: fliN: flagellar motor switch protein FliN [Firmicutes bacterium]|nr:fliN: flagellar motor switch protein FliN [Bacillota bacterium]
MNSGFLSQEEIDALLRGEPSAAPQEEPITDIEKDAMGEIGNISMGSAATTLSILLSRRVSITTPKVTITNLNEIKHQYPLPYLVIEVGYTAGLSGSNLLAMRSQDALIIADLMMGGDGTNPPTELNELYMSAVSEAMNQMMGAVATSMSTIFKKKIDIAPPRCNIMDFSVDTDIESFPSKDEPVAQVSFRMEVEDLIDSEIMQILSIPVVKEVVGNLFSKVEEESAAPAPAAPTSPPAAQVQMPPPAPRPVPVPQPMVAAQPSGYVQNQSNVTVQPAQFAAFTPGNIPGIDPNISLLMDVPLQVTVELGRTRKLIRDILELSPGSVVELDKLAGEPVDILANGKLIAKGEVVVIDENFGVRVTEIIGQIDRTALQYQ